MLHILTGPVVHGQGKGTDAGFPTANLYLPEGTALPPFGVYWTRAAIGEQDTLGVTNAGLRPTADDREDVTVETFLPDFEGDLYGQTIRLTFLRYLRETVRFQAEAAFGGDRLHSLRIVEIPLGGYAPEWQTLSEYVYDHEGDRLDCRMIPYEDGIFTGRAPGEIRFREGDLCEVLTDNDVYLGFVVSLDGGAMPFERTLHLAARQVGNLPDEVWQPRQQACHADRVW